MDFAHHSYYSSVARLNAEFADWVQQQVRKDKAVCLKQGIRDYTVKLERLEKETGVSVGKLVWRMNMGMGGNVDLV